MRFQTNGEINPDKSIQFLDVEYSSLTDLKIKMTIFLIIIIIKIVVLILIIWLIYYCCKRRSETTKINNWMVNRQQREPTNI